MTALQNLSELATARGELVRVGLRVSLVLLASACGGQRARPQAAAAPMPESSASPAPSEPEPGPVEPERLEQAAELALEGWIPGDVGGSPVERIVWDEAARDALVFVGGPWGLADQFMVHASLALADSTSPARFTIEALACRIDSPRGAPAGATRAFGTTLRWYDVTERALEPGGCMNLALGIDADAWIQGTPPECPPTAHAYAATHCAHGLCLRFVLFDDVPPAESALAQAVGSGTFAWVSPPRPAGPCH